MSVSERYEDTIVAPATASGSSVSIVRLSGERAQHVLGKLVSHPERSLEAERKLVPQRLLDLLAGSAARALDQALVCFFKAPESFTGEDIVEFHVHGSPYIVSRLLENCVACGARLAEPGEFSKRAFLGGKLDLSQAEAICDLIAAETEAQALVASAQLAGKLSQVVQRLGEPLRNLLAEIEAFIDFPEEDIHPESVQAWAQSIEQTLGEVNTLLDTFQTGKLYRDGARVTIAGLPNAGKSSLLNCLLGEERAIVTAQAGTTRDTIEEHLSISGLNIRLTDTAGLRDEPPTDDVEQLGIERSWKQIGLADLVIYLTDLTADVRAEQKLFQRVKASAKATLLVGNKLDLIPGQSLKQAIGQFFQAFFVAPIVVSARGVLGIDALKAAIADRLLSDSVPASAARVLVTNQRHADALRTAAEALANSLQALSTNTPPEFISADLRLALGALNDIIGVTYTEDILGRIFSKFCIGK